MVHSSLFEIHFHPIAAAGESRVRGASGCQRQCRLHSPPDNNRGSEAVHFLHALSLVYWLKVIVHVVQAGASNASVALALGECQRLLELSEGGLRLIGPGDISSLLSSVTPAGVCVFMCLHPFVLSMCSLPRLRPPCSIQPGCG